MATHPKKRAIDQLSLDPTIATPTKLRLEAIFHPKFENQTLHVRQQMLDRLRSCRGSLEATLKYSGSLLLWSGGDRFYSKNATDNIYTLVGEMLLQQHFGRAHAHYTDKNPHAMYQACRRHVDEHRLTLAFEVVTAVLGDHGQRPRRDFVILTAVADRSLGRFYSTAEMVELALQYRLPYNDAFLYTDVASAEALFRLYDQCWTSGRANEVMAGLRSTANVHVPSMMDHEAFQGDLLEGFVVRYVEGDCQRLTDLVDRAKELQRQVPSDLEDCFRLYQESDGRLWCTNIRDLSKQAQGSVSDLESKLRKLLDHESDCRLRRASPAQVTEAWSAAPLSQVLSSDPLVASSNKETRQIAQLVRRVSQLNLAVHYTAFCQGNRWLCGIHVLYDNCFMKYNKNKQPTDMPLYRGFVVELVGPNDGQVEDTSETEMNDSHVDATATEEPLMLKMKLLPYLLRTAGCRNGLRYLQKGGIEVYLRYARDWLSRSQVPSDVRESSLEFLKAWGFYAQSMLSGGQLATEYGKDLPPLTSDCYLDHYDLFERLYRDKIDFFSDKESAGDFRGLVVVVAIQRETADKAADEIAKRLEARREMGAPVAITEEQLLLMRERGRGAVYSCIVTDGIMRRLLKGGLDCISVVVVGCSSNEIAKQIEGLDVSLQKKSVGMLNAWRKVKWASISEVPWSAFTEESGQGATSLSDAIRSLLDVSSSLVKEDESPGLLVFFASAIPGCGKSSLLDSKTVASLEADIKQLGGNRPRPVVARMGDQTQGKFWPLVAKERLSAQSTVYIADKNVPSNTWKLVAEIGAKSKGVLVPVVYDSAVFQTTCINGLRDSNGILCGGKEHMYPFSLSFLAVCLARVSDRPAATHVGKLDSGTERASMIVIKFYTLYRHLTAEAFQDELDAVVSGSGAVISSTPVEVPFFASDDASDSIPNVLKGLLVEALQAQYGCECQKVDPLKAKSDYLDSLDQRLRSCIDLHRHQLLSLTVDKDVSRKFFVDRLLERVAEVDTLGTYTALSRRPFVKIASLDVDLSLVHDVLRQCREESFHSFWQAAVGGQSVEEALTGPCFVTDTHVTMAHFKQMRQATMYATFGPLVGQPVALQVTAFLWSDAVAALAVTLPPHTQQGAVLPASANSFPHITVWVAKGAQSKQSNDLPRLVAEDKATRVNFDPPLVLSSIVSLWTLDRKST